VDAFEEILDTLWCNVSLWIYVDEISEWREEYGVVYICGQPGGFTVLDVHLKYGLYEYNVTASREVDD
jgi:hypothetical protein